VSLLAVWVFLTVACVILGIYQVKFAWNALPISLGPIEFSLTIYPPLVLCVWMVFLLGFEWAFLSAYLATFSLALYSGMSVSLALLFALVDPLALAVYALAYRSVRIPFDSRNLKGAIWFLFVSFFAAVAGSLGSFIWSEAHDLAPVETFAIWQGWWVGAFLQAVLLNAPVLAVFARRVEEVKLSKFKVPPFREPKLKWIMVSIAAGGLIVCGFLLATGELASMRLSQALGTDVSDATRRAIVNAIYGWKLTLWTGMVLTVAGSFGGIFLAYSWNRGLVREVRTRTLELQESEQRFRVTFSQAAVGIAHVAPDGRWLRVNQKLCDIVGYSRDELLERTFQDITYPDDLDVDVNNVQRVLSEEIQTYSMEKRYVQKTGALIWVNLTVSLARDRHNQPRYFISIVEDITERKRLEDQLRQSQKMEAIGQLAGGVAHDFNNILTVIGGYGQMVLTEADQNELLKHYAQEINDSVDRAAALTGQLLAFSRRQVTQPKNVNLNQLVANMKHMLRRLLGENIELTTIPSGFPETVKIDPVQMQQVIVNLAVNAKDAMPDGGKVTILVSEVTLDQRPHVMLAIGDTGIGMDPEVQSHMFEPFYSTKPRGKGTGLGLSIVYGIIKQAGGSIEVKSQVGEGAILQIFLPKILDSELPQEWAKTAGRIALGSETILLVEDEERVRRLIGQVLRDSGYTVVEADSGEDAMDACRRFSQPIHLLVTDLIMPGINGRTLAERLRQSRPGLKVLYISGYTENILDMYGPLNSGTGFLQKPFAPAALTQKLRELLGEL
jgi:PAS domain S-box-containing protein